MRYRAAYAEVNTSVKRKIWTDKKAYMEELAREAEKAAQKGDQKKCL